MPRYSRKQDRLVPSNQKHPCEWGWTDNKQMNRMDKIISDSDVGHEENKTQQCDGECARVERCGHFMASGQGRPL